MHEIILVDKNGLEHKLNFFIPPVDSSGIVALQEAGIEYDLEIDQFQNDTVVIEEGVQSLKMHLITQETKSLPINPINKLLC